tara:strand:- start:242 stop:463 length:222 start_codon:yes stop_codon:yes gene_type:complete
MPEGYNGLNFGSFNLSEFTSVYFNQVTESYFHSLAIEDIWNSVEPIETVYTPVDSIQSVFTPVESIATTFTPV